MFRITLIFFIVLTGLSGPVGAQQPEVSTYIEDALATLANPESSYEQRLQATERAVEFFKNDQKKAEKLYLDAINRAKEAKKIADQYYLLNRLASLFRDSPKSLAYLKQALPLAASAGEKEPLRLQIRIAQAMVREMQYAKAVELYEEILPDFRKTATKMELASALSSYGNAVYFKKDYEKALELGEVVQSIAIKASATPVETQGLILQARALQQLGEYDKAVRAYNEALQKAIGLGNQSLQTNILLDIAAMLERQGEHARAVPHLKKALEMGPESLPLQQRIALYVRLARIHLNLNKPQEGLGYINEAQELIAGRRSNATMVVQVTKGRLLYELGEKGRGIDLMQRGLSRNDDLSGNTLADRLFVAEYFSEKGVFKAAETEYAILEKQAKKFGNGWPERYRDAWKRHLARKSGKKIKAIAPTTEEAYAQDQAKKKIASPKVRQKSQAAITFQDSVLLVERERELALLDAENRRKAAELRQNEFRFYLFLLGLTSLLVVLSIFTFWYRSRKLQLEVLAEKERQIRLLELEEAELRKQAEVVEALVKGQEGERKRIAESLHDDVGSMLSALRLQLERIDTESGTASKKAHGSLRQAVEMLDQVSTDVRNLSHVLMPTAIGKFGLKKALEVYTDQLNKSGKVHFELMITGLDAALDEQLELSCYRILLELCNNVLKHAEARNVLIEIVEHDDELVLMVEDNGRGFEPADNSADGLGLRTIESRMHLLKGRLTVDSRPGHGARITLEIPKPNQNLNS